MATPAETRLRAFHNPRHEFACLLEASWGQYCRRPSWVPVSAKPTAPLTGFEMCDIVDVKYFAAPSTDAAQEDWLALVRLADGRWASMQGRQGSCDWSSEYGTFADVHVAASLRDLVVFSITPAAAARVRAYWRRRAADFAEDTDVQISLTGLPD
jgi:hypothetical protein